MRRTKDGERLEDEAIVGLAVAVDDEELREGRCRISVEHDGRPVASGRNESTHLIDEVGRPEGATREKAPVPGAVLVLDGEVAEEEHARRDGQGSDRDPALSTGRGSVHWPLHVDLEKERRWAHLGIRLGRHEKDELQREGDEEEEVCGHERSRSALTRLLPDDDE